jgi:hypothetical protein
MLRGENTIAIHGIFIDADDKAILALDRFVNILSSIYERSTNARFSLLA